MRRIVCTERPNVTTNNLELATSTIFTRATPIARPVSNRPHRQPLSPPQRTITVYPPLHSAQYHLMPIAGISPSPVLTINSSAAIARRGPLSAIRPRYLTDNTSTAHWVYVYTLSAYVCGCIPATGNRCVRWPRGRLGGAGRKWGGGECSDCR